MTVDYCKKCGKPIACELAEILKGKMPQMERCSADSASKGLCLKCYENFKKGGK